ncbi:HELC1 [Enterospora canceri]|uniref:HELC1 n=1 Tax=Enterospora canceri TaxID=1081671 RepID=A0A1Y1S677_9MICR|nr:HELC1 [Enterospora canceri]
MKITVAFEEEQKHLKMSNKKLTETIEKLAGNLSITSDQMIDLLVNTLSKENYESNLVDLLGFDSVEEIFTIVEYRNEITAMKSSKDPPEESENDKYTEYLVQREVVTKKKSVEVIPVTKLIKNGRILLQDKMTKINIKTFFKYTHFNEMQSTMFETAYNTNGNYLLSAPTGSGKTDVALLSILKNFRNRDKKVVYVVPMRALATEVVRKYTKMLRNTLKVVEYTGDTDIAPQEANRADMIVCTPEKFDLTTRRLNSPIKSISLVIIDEIHLLDNTRGVVLETIVVRIQQMGINNQEIIRIIALSATVPNYKEIAEFIRGKAYHFGQEYRPVTLESRLIGFRKLKEEIKEEKEEQHDISEKLETIQIINNKPVKEKTVKKAKTNLEKQNDRYVFENKLEYLIEKMKKHETKQSLVFTTSRGNTTRIAQNILRKQGISVDQKTSLLKYKIGVHHAGLSRKERLETEEAFRDGRISTLICTTTLAWGVNLPADVVFIFDTVYYDLTVGNYVDMHILDVFQIEGRAGRLEYTKATKAHSYIFCSHSSFNSFKHKLSLNYKIKSNLHKKIRDIMLSEIYLRNITDHQGAVDWYTKTFSSVLCYEVDLDSTLAALHCDGLVHKETSISNPFEFTTSPLAAYAVLHYVSCKTLRLFVEQFRDIRSTPDCIELLVQSDVFDNITVRQDETVQLISLLESGDLYQHTAALDPNTSEFSARDKLLILFLNHLYNPGMKLGYTLHMDTVYLIENSTRTLELLKKILVYYHEYDRYVVCSRLSVALKSRITTHKMGHISTTVTEINKFTTFKLDPSIKFDYIALHHENRIVWLTDITECTYITDVTDYDRMTLSINGVDYDIQYSKMPGISNQYKNINLIQVMNIFMGEREAMMNYKIVEIVEQNMPVSNNGILVITRKSDIDRTITSLNIMVSIRLSMFDLFSRSNVVSDVSDDTTGIIVYKGIRIMVKNSKNEYVIDTANNLRIYC